MKIEGSLSGQSLKFAVIASRFNDFIVSRLVDGALSCLQRHGVIEEDIDTIWTPGAFELPLTALLAAESHKYEAIICLGAVIRGSTPHFDYVSNEVAKGISHVSLKTQIPTLFGVLTCDTTEQAIERAGTKAGNKGHETALAAIEMANLKKRLTVI